MSFQTLFFAYDGNIAAPTFGMLTKWFKPQKVVLSRGVCTHYNLNNEASLSREQMAKLAYLRAIEKSPFKEVGAFVSVGTKYTSIWSWDAALVADKTGKASINCLPESAMIDVSQNGFQFVQSLDGYEGCLIQDGSIIKSRWWAKIPTEGEWKKFILSAEEFGAQIPDQTEIAQKLTLANQAIPKNDLTIKDALTQVHLDRLLLAALLLFFAAIAYPSARNIYLYGKNTSLEHKIDQSNSMFEDRLDVVSRITAAENDVKIISRQFSKPPILISFAQAAGLIVNNGGALQRINYEAEEWEILFSASSELEPTNFVRSLEAETWIKDVSIQPDRRENYWTVSFKVQRQYNSDS